MDLLELEPKPQQAETDVSSNKLDGDNDCQKRGDVGLSTIPVYGVRHPLSMNCQVCERDNHP